MNGRSDENSQTLLGPKSKDPSSKHTLPVVFILNYVNVHVAQKMSRIKINRDIIKLSITFIYYLFLTL